MLGTLALSLVAGFFVTRWEEILKALIDRMAANGMRLPLLDFRVLALLTMQALVAIVLLFLGADSSLFVAALGFGVGYFTPRIMAFIQDPDSVMGPSVWDEGDGPPEAPALPESNFDLDMETLRAVRSELDHDRRR